MNFILGDIHGNVKKLQRIIDAGYASGGTIYQIGDFGLGDLESFWFTRDDLDDINYILKKTDTQLKVIRGNHDNPKYWNDDIERKFNLLRQGILAQPRDAQVLAEDVKAMRTKMRNHLDKSSKQHIDIKQGIGGLVDIEFLAQYLVLKNSHQFLAVAKYSDNIRIFTELTRAGILNTEQQAALTQAYCQLRDQGHRAALQNERLLLDETIFEQCTKDVVIIWQQFLA